jgi:hypothetical protein
MHASFPPFTRPASAAPVSAISDTEAKLRTALAYVNHARDLLREALGDAVVPEAGSLDALRIERSMPPNCDFARDDEATGL